MQRRRAARALRQTSAQGQPGLSVGGKRGYVRVPPDYFNYASGTGFGLWSDFSPETIEQRANEGYKQTDRALQA
jgi:hypothetical protein